MRTGPVLCLLAVLGLAVQTQAVLLTAAGLAGAGALTGLAGGLGGLLGLKLVALKAGAIGYYLGSKKFGGYRHSRHYGGYGHGGYGGHGHGGYGGHGHGGYGGHGYGGQKGHGYHRRRRDTVAVEPLESYFEMVAAADVRGCGLRLVCELEARDPTTLAADEVLILSLFNDVSDAPRELLEKSAKAQYDMAAYVGLSGKASACQALYENRCPFNGEQLMSALRSVDPE